MGFERELAEERAALPIRHLAEGDRQPSRWRSVDSSRAQTRLAGVRVSWLGSRQRSVVVAVPLVGTMQPPLNEVIDMIAVRDSHMPAVLTVPVT